MMFSGFADEAGKDLETQLRAHTELGWTGIELRNVGGKQFTEATDDEFDAIRKKIDDAGIRVTAFGSAVANWARPITGDFTKDVEDIERCIPRMQTLGCRYIRAMSWPNDKDNPLSDEEWGKEAVRRMQELAKRAEDGNIVICIENCDGWASESPKHYAEFIQRVGAPAVKCVYDTGNAASHGRNDTWEWYEAAKPHIEYVHVKANTGPIGDDADHVFPDDPRSASLVKETFVDLFRNGYDGIISIEPHMKAIAHLGKEIDDADAAYQTYLEYGRRTMKVVEEARRA